jgi:hypothetical protein
MLDVREKVYHRMVYDPLLEQDLWHWLDAGNRENVKYLLDLDGLSAEMRNFYRLTAQKYLLTKFLEGPDVRHD